jgi:2-desacetyl-2-hydroxyethyl bacteriochlorophyllide A dehydrogenase
MEAKAVVFTAPRMVAVKAVQCPDPGPGDIVVRTTHSWISNGTEGSFLRGERVQGDTAYRQGDRRPFPTVAGYQKIGVVERVGQGVQDLTVGETVFCAMGRVSGMFHEWGGQLSHSVTVRSMIWKLPQGCDPLAFSGLVLTQVGYNCGARAPIRPGGAAVVIGDGMVGHWAAQTLAWRGADVLMVGRHADRLAKFAEGPYRHVVNARQTDWLQAVRQRFTGGVSVAVDTVGDLKAVNDLVWLMEGGGHIVSAGFYGTEDLLSLQLLRQREVSLDSVSGWSGPRMDQTLHLIAAGYLQTLPLITHRFPVDRAAEAWELILSKREPVLGVILDW